MIRYNSSGVKKKKSIVVIVHKLCKEMLCLNDPYLGIPWKYDFINLAKIIKTIVQIHTLHIVQQLLVPKATLF